jgi:hypothetical protein
MKLEGLTFSGGLDDAAIIIKALEALPDNTIQGFSNYDKSTVKLIRRTDFRFGVEIRGPAPTYGEGLKITFPEDSTKQETDGKRGVSQFEYNQIIYTVINP